MITRKTTSIAIGLAAILAATSACSSDTGKEGGSGANEVSMIVNITPNLTESWWNELVKPFEDANDIDVKIVAPVAKNVQESLPQLLASGDVPDVVQSLTPTKDIIPELVDLSGYEWASNGPLAATYAFDGKNYVAGIGMQLQSIYFYNKTAFQEAGITEAPTTLAELEKDLQLLKDAGWTPLQTGGDWNTRTLLEVMGLPTIVAENPKWFYEVADGTTKWSDSYASTTQLYKSWVEKGFIPKDAVGIKYPEGEQQFLSGKTAIYPMGSWFAAAEANSDVAGNFGVFRAPSVDGVTAPKMGSNLASPYMIMKASKNQDNAAKLIEFLVTDKEAVVTQLAVDTNFRDGYDYPMSDLAKELQAIVADTPEADFIPTGKGFGEQILPGGYDDELNTQTQALLGGGTPEDMGAAMDAWLTENR